MRICPFCAKDILDKDLYCKYCGQKLPKTTLAPQERRRIDKTENDLPSYRKIEIERTASNAQILEIIFGIFSILGMGWLYAGNLSTGILALGISIFIVFPIEVGAAIGSGGVCLCFIIPMNLVIAFLSGNNARAWALTNRAINGSIMRLFVGFIVVIIAYIIVATIFGALIAKYIESILPESIRFLNF